MLIEEWVPQKQLLSSGLISIFISSCGNNARLEATYFLVPLLCIPLYGEQPMISNIILHNEFGGMITKEKLSEETITQTINETLQNKVRIVEKMKISVGELKMSPVSQEELLVHHVKMLVKFGKRSRSVKGTSENNNILNFIDFYNLDLLSLGILLLTCTIILAKYILSKIFILIVRFIHYMKYLYAWKLHNIQIYYIVC